MKIIKNKEALESIFLLVLFSLLLFLGPANILDNKIFNDMPYGYFASDAFMHLSYTQFLHDSGQFRYYSPYMEQGIENVAAFNPPILYHLASIFSYVSGLELWNSLIFLTFIFVILAALIMYLMVRKLSIEVALLSSPLFVLLFYNVFKISYVFGTWIYVLGSFFLVASFWILTNFELKYSFLVLGIFLSAIALTHTSEYVFAGLFLGFYLLTRIIFRKFKIDDFKNIFYSGLISLVLSFNYLIIFKNSWGKNVSFSVQTLKEATGSQFPSLFSFGILLILIFLGMVLSFFVLRKKFNDVILVGFFMFLIGFSNYIGFAHRAFQTRYFWPIYLSIFLGLVLYQITKLIQKKLNFIHYAILAVILLFGFSYFYYDSFSGGSLFNPYNWEGVQWVSKNTPENSKVLFFYGDSYSQNAMLMTTKRLSHYIRPDSFIEALQNKEIKQNYIIKTTGESAGGMPYRKSFFKFGYYMEEIPGIIEDKERNICDYDYLLFDKFSREPVLVQYNMLIAQELLKNEFIEQVFNNDGFLILRNKNIGVDCIEKRSF